MRVLFVQFGEILGIFFEKKATRKWQLFKRRLSILFFRVYLRFVIVWKTNKKLETEIYMSFILCALLKNRKVIFHNGHENNE